MRRGDILWADLAPRSGSEQTGRRPVLLVSNDGFNSTSRWCSLIHEAVRGVLTHSLSYWDAQIWSVARLNQISLVLSEDFANGSTVGGVTFLNPFHQDFPVKALQFGVAFLV